MVEILIRGGNAEAAATAMAEQLRTIFGTEPVRSSRRPDSGRDLLAPETLVFTIPPGVLAMADIIHRLQLVERVDRLIHGAEPAAKTNGATILIDPGDGKPIPLEQASRQAILDALTAVEAKLRAAQNAQH